MRFVLPLLLVLGAVSLTTQALPSVAPRHQEREPGLTLRLFQLPFAPDELPELAPGQTPNVDRRIDRLDLGTEDFGALDAPHLTRALGWLLVEDSGVYRFRLTSDDGARLFVGGERLIDNDGRHGMRAVESADLELRTGEHALLVEHFDGGGNRGLVLEWLTPGADEFVLVPTSALVCEVDPTRVTSPGVKAVVDGRRPGLGLPLSGVHPGWRVEDLRPEGLEPMVGSLCFLPDGRLAFGTFDPLQRDEESLPDIESKAPDRIWAMDLETREVSEIASDVYEPSGLCVVDGELYVAHRRSIDRLVDGDGDGYFETHERIADGWEGWNYHQFAFGLVHRDGKLYTALSTSMAPPGWEGMGTNAGPNGPLRGSVLEVDLSSGTVTAIAGGARTPNGLGTWRGRLLYTDNQGAWYPASALHEVVPGRFFGHYNRTNLVPKLAERFPEGGHPSVYADRPRSVPVLWLPHGEVVNSPTTPLEIPEGPYAGQLLIGELTAGGIRRAFLEEVDGVLQGALFRFTQGLESGVNRLVLGPDGALYVGGIGAGGNWNWNGTRFGLQRLVPNGAPTFEIHSVEAIADGFRVRFTDSVPTRELEDLERYTAESWTYEPTSAYGGPKLDVREHRVLAVERSEGNSVVTVRLEGLSEGRVVHLGFDLESREGAELWSGECWYTLNRLPRGSAPGTGLDAEPGPDGVWLMAGGNGACLATRERPSNLDGDEVAARTHVSLSAGDDPLATRVEVGGTIGVTEVHVELRCPDGPADVRLVWGGTEYVVPRDRLGSDWLAVDVRWHSTGYRRFVDFDDGTASERLENRVMEGTPGPISNLGPIEVHCDEGRVDVRDLWVRAPRRRSVEESAGWIDLLADPDALVVRGGDARYVIEDGVLTGETRPNTPNTFMTTVETFGDFELVFDVNVDTELNSGVQIRSEVVGGFDERTGGLKGYQVEIDPSPRAWSGGIYEERDRGWLHPLYTRPFARRAWRQEDWNRIRVVADGPVIRTWVNGVPTTDLLDARRSEGHIGFQVHGVGGREDPLQVRWRNVRLRRIAR